MSLTIPFVSTQPKLGNPPLHWEAFENPKLRRFPGSSSFQLEDYLGGGEDGFAFKAHIEKYGPVAVKVFPHNRQPEPIHGIGRYWAFERECINCALLEMINASLRCATATERTIYLLPNPTTKSQALRNLWAFSEGSIEKSPPQHFEPFSPNVRTNDCLGWTELKGSTIIPALTKAGIPGDIKNEEIYFCIIYAFVSKGQIDADVILSQLNFFHIVGFYNVPFNPSNWRGEGVLVDFSDIVSPFAHELDWDRGNYAIDQAMYRATVQGLVRRGRL